MRRRSRRWRCPIPTWPGSISRAARRSSTGCGAPSATTWTATGPTPASRGRRGAQEGVGGRGATAHADDDAEWDETLRLVDSTSPYALTGSVFAHARRAIREAAAALRHAAGNFYVNDKPTGAVVGQQPFGGARASGTNDKAGSKLNLVRWVSARTIKETFAPPREFKYPFMNAE